jgi:PPOX class probable F420-dependent enzyme
LRSFDANAGANPHVAVVVDLYSENWSKLAWVILRGPAELVTTGPSQATGVRLLEERYPQYASMPLAGRPMVVVQVERMSAWRAAS